MNKQRLFDSNSSSEEDETAKTHPMKGNYIFIDIQGFYVKNRFIPKEIALLNQEFEEVLSESRILHYTVKPPYEFKNLTTKDMDDVLHATDYKHGLLWTDGEIDCQDRLQQLERAIEDAHSIFRMCYVYVNSDNTEYCLSKTFPKFFKQKSIYWLKNINDDYIMTEKCYFSPDYKFSDCRHHLNIQYRCALRNVQWMYHMKCNANQWDKI
ncbi:hypothetical protein QAD02_002670 [Eretmocerus hayati]|uniref:Uncharacterized protein n=1 Tax=Eretmocerus hayati TaxID=131215 RepID=A0ACC2NLB2_9HYME|nr:hypothetical protein QAD02_002670 [Eretmocerus hayati]